MASVPDWIALCVSRCCVVLDVIVLCRAQKLHADRKAEMDQAMTQMDDRQEQLHQLADEKETASKYKAAAEAKLAVSAH